LYVPCSLPHIRPLSKQVKWESRNQSKPTPTILLILIARSDPAESK
jgi:hypothetical protein